jgi:N-acetylmuramoyl-L-alanine amidase
VCYIGGVDEHGIPKDTRTNAQKKSLLEILTKLKKMFPTAVIQGHRNFPNVQKACPSFDARTEYSTLK